MSPDRERETETSTRSNKQTTTTNHETILFCLFFVVLYFFSEVVDDALVVLVASFESHSSFADVFSSYGSGRVRADIARTLPKIEKIRNLSRAYPLYQSLQRLS